MTQARIAIGIIIAVLIIIAGIFAYDLSRTGPASPVACTAEAKMCPDGSYVGRTGPDCAFAACPSAPPAPITVSAKLGEGAAALGIVVTPVALVEDSRCSIDVACIQAGTVEVRVNVQSGMGSSTEIFELGQATTTEGREITLAAVDPAPVSTVPKGAREYTFHFEIAEPAP